MHTLSEAGSLTDSRTKMRMDESLSTAEMVEPPSPDAGRRSRRRLVFWGGLLVVFLALAVRLAWVASRTETGWETITQQWRDATVGLVLGDHVPVGSLEPIDQAEFWLRETDRILAADPDNAELAMGAALVLDSPAWGFCIGILSRWSVRPVPAPCSARN